MFPLSLKIQVSFVFAKLHLISLGLICECHKNQRAGRLLLLFGSPNMQNLHHLQPNKPWQRTHVVLYNEHTLNDQLHQNMHDLAHEL